MRDGPKLIVEYMTTYQLLSLERFWEHIPPGLLNDVVDEAADTLQKIRQSVLTGACNGCGSVRTLMVPLHNKIWERLADFARASEAGKGLEPLLTFISKKRGYLPTQVIVYYTSNDGRQLILRF